MFRIMLWSLIYFASSAHALQIKNWYKDNRVIADISLNSINRIAIAEDRIAQVFGLTEDLVIETDNNTGQIFLRTKQNKPIDLTIITEQQVTLDLSLLPKDISGETIIIKTNQPTAPVKINAKTNSYLEQITTLMLAMANDQSTIGYSINKVHKEVLLWDKIDLLQTSEYVGNKLIGAVYSLTNNTKDRIFLTETQFGWQKGVASVAIKKHALAPKESTQIYVIRHV